MLLNLKVYLVKLMKVTLVFSITAKQIFKNGLDKSIGILPLSFEHQVSEELDLLGVLKETQLCLLLKCKQGTQHIVLSEKVHDHQKHIFLCNLELYHIIRFNLKNVQK